MTKLGFIDKINDILIGLNTAESDALGSLYDELMRSQWIPVEERLPKERGQYFVYTAAGQSWQSEWMQDFKGVWRWYASPVVLGIIANVTHWMEIVPPRKEANNEDS